LPDENKHNQASSFVLKVSSTHREFFENVRIISDVVKQIDDYSLGLQEPIARRDFEILCYDINCDLKEFSKAKFKTTSELLETKHILDRKLDIFLDDTFLYINHADTKAYQSDNEIYDKIKTLLPTISKVIETPDFVESLETELFGNKYQAPEDTVTKSIKLAGEIKENLTKITDFTTNDEILSQNCRNASERLQDHDQNLRKIEHSFNTLERVNDLIDQAVAPLNNIAQKFDRPLKGTLAKYKTLEMDFGTQINNPNLSTYLGKIEESIKCLIDLSKEYPVLKFSLEPIQNNIEQLQQSTAELKSIRNSFKDIRMPREL
jgi:chromosome segregation ATPase